MDGYRLLRKGRLGRRGGGVALWPRVQLECTELHLGMNSDSAESLWVRISRQTNTGSIVEGVCYRPPAEEEVVRPQTAGKILMFTGSGPHGRL